MYLRSENEDKDHEITTMPYIEKETRKKLNPAIDSLANEINTVGELNYCITRFCLNFLEKSVVSYVTLNEIIGLLECIKLEFYRRVLSFYEDKKCSENGDVYIYKDD